MKSKTMEERRQEQGLTKVQIRIALECRQALRNTGASRALDAIALRLLGRESYRELAGKHAEALDYTCGFFAEKSNRVYDHKSNVHRVLLAREWVRALRYCERHRLRAALESEVSQVAERLAAEVMNPRAGDTGREPMRRLVDPYLWAGTVGRVRRFAVEAEDASTAYTEVEREAARAVDDPDFDHAFLYWLGHFLRVRDEQIQREGKGGVLGFLQFLDTPPDGGDARTHEHVALGEALGPEPL